MSAVATDRLYKLLPAVYRAHETETDAPLKALLRIAAREVDLVEADIQQLYDNWFIETCDEWVVPYIGDLLQVRGLLPVRGRAFTQRSFVANTLGYRRRKGTAGVLEQLAADLTGWPARAVEFFQRVVTTRNVNHVRAINGGTASVRGASDLELLNGPFETASHSVDVRHVDNARGRYNIPNIGVFLWRLMPFPIERGQARSYAEVDPTLDPALQGRTWTISPLGITLPLFNVPRAGDDITRLAGEEHVPAALRARPLHDELRAYRQTVASGSPAPDGTWLTPTPRADSPVVRIVLDGTVLLPEEIRICNLETWRRPAPSPITKPDGTTVTIRAALDPVRGRIALASEQPSRVEVDYAYGFSAPMGGGPYDRTWTTEEQSSLAVDSAVALIGDTVANPGALATRIALPSVGIATLQQAVDAAGAFASAVIELVDSHTYAGATLSHAVSPLVIQAANGARPVIRGDITVPAGGPRQLVLDGLLIAGSVSVGVGVDDILVRHSTLVPGPTLTAPGTPQAPRRASMTVDSANNTLHLAVVSSIVGPIRLPATMEGLRVVDSIVDGVTGTGIAAIAADDAATTAAPATTILRSTIVGPVRVRELTLGSNSIFRDGIVAERRQTGCVRYSYVPTGSRTPRQFHCQPQLAVDLATAAEAARRGVSSLPTADYDAIAADVRARVTPVFTSARFGDPAYGQLATSCAREILEGADDEDAMGAFNGLQQARRLRNLRAVIGDSLRVGLEVGVFLAT